MLDVCKQFESYFMEQVFKQMGLPIVDYVWFFDNEYLETADDIIKSIDKLGYPVIVKPVNSGSSVGIGVGGRAKRIHKDSSADQCHHDAYHDA